MIRAGCFEKLFDVIGGLPHLALRVMLCGGDELLIGAINILIVNTLIVAGGGHGSLWSPPLSPLVAFSTPPWTLVGCLGWRPWTATGGCLGAALHKNSPDCFLARGMPSGNVEEFFCGLWLVTTKLMYEGSAVCAGSEC
jgi:hypothetical protein